MPQSSYTCHAAMVNKGRRSNSLGFARTDCHTCASLGDQCDRQRPRCSTCLDHGRRCGGFATSLSWDSRRMLTEGSSASQVRINAAHDGDGQSTAAGRSPATLRHFRFVPTRSRQRARRKGRSASKQGTARNQVSGRRSESQAVAEMANEPGLAAEDSNANAFNQNRNYSG